MSIERVDFELCNGCGICVNTCPMDCIRLDTLVTERYEYPECRLACPAGVDMRTYIDYLKYGMVREALAVLRESLPLPAVTGHICPHPCETACVRGKVDDAVNINALERFVADYWINEKAEPVRKIYASKVAVVGSGPAGLSCAYFLARMGYPVTVFEALPALGGMLRVGVPEYRLPVKVLDAQIKYIEDMGVAFKTSTTIGKDMTLTDLQKEGYEAILLSIGAQLSQKVKIEGSNLDGVMWGIDFLRGIKSRGQSMVKGKTVAVAGGGNVAVTVALSVLRLGAKEVHLACLESRDKMPAFEEDIRQAEEEKIKIHSSWGVKAILGNGTRVTGIELKKCIRVFEEISVFSPAYVEGGVFNPVFDEKTTKTINAEVVIFAVGQTTDLSLLSETVRTTENGTIQVDPVTLETTVPGAFACGDVASGPGLAVEAMAAGKNAAVSIDRYLKGLDMRSGRTVNPSHVLKPPCKGIENLKRLETPMLPVEERRGNFKEVKMGYSEDVMTREARRCMTCGSRAVVRYPDDCMLCLYCERDCPQRAIYVSPEKKIEPLIGWR